MLCSSLHRAQVPAGLFVFVCDVDFLPSRNLHADLVSGKHRKTLMGMRADFAASGRRAALVLPALERRKSHRFECGDLAGCEVLADLAVPRTFDALRVMYQAGNVVDIFHRTSVRLAATAFLCAVDRGPPASLYPH